MFTRKDLDFTDIDLLTTNKNIYFQSICCYLTKLWSDISTSSWVSHKISFQVYLKKLQLLLFISNFFQGASLFSFYIYLRHSQSSLIVILKESPLHFQVYVLIWMPSCIIENVMNWDKKCSSDLEVWPQLLIWRPSAIDIFRLCK